MSTDKTDLHFSLLPIGFEDFLVSSYANALDDKHFSSNAGDAMRGRGETKYQENKSERSLCQISYNICSICKDRSRRWKSLTFHCKIYCTKIVKLNVLYHMSFSVSYSSNIVCILPPGSTPY